MHTGWAPQDRETFSDILTLWGHGLSGRRLRRSRLSPTPIPLKPTTYALQIEAGSYIRLGDIAGGEAGLAALDQRGNWVNAVDLNTGEANRPKFVMGPGNPAMVSEPTA